jgi:tRNA(fMet)-specific endonuclease VapC
MNGGRIDFIADTSVIVGLLRSNKQIEQTVRDKNFAITCVTLAELSLGVLKSAKCDTAWSRVQEVLRDRQMLHASTVTPAIYARIYFDLEQRGSMIPINDIWIAAFAIETQVPLLARDEHFSRGAGLSVIAC